MTIDLTGIDTEATFHLLMKERLDFPEGYGKNWDAFWDTITGLVEMPPLLILDNWGDFARACPKDMQILREITDQYNEEIPDKKILFA